MSRERLRQAVTIAVLAAAGALALGMKAGWRLPQPSSGAAQSSPQDPIYAMLDAARQGSVTAYLACYTGAMRTALDASVRESGTEAFARYLRDSNAAIKGVAMNEPEPLSPAESRVRVEYVYQERNEMQNLYLEKSAGAWKISRVDGAERVKTLVPYGTPVR
jgi:hypothetical protein